MGSPGQSSGGVAETIEIDVPRASVGSELTEALAAHGLEAETLDAGDRCVLRLRFATGERERLLDHAVHSLELLISERELPLVVQRANGGAVLRPPAD